MNQEPRGFSWRGRAGDGQTFVMGPTTVEVDAGSLAIFDLNDAIA